METDERGPRVPGGDDRSGEHRDPLIDLGWGDDDPAPEPSEDFDEDSGDDLDDDFPGEASAGDWEEESEPAEQSWGDGDP